MFLDNQTSERAAPLYEAIVLLLTCIDQKSLMAGSFLRQGIHVCCSSVSDVNTVVYWVSEFLPLRWGYYLLKQQVHRTQFVFRSYLVDVGLHGRTLNKVRVKELRAELGTYPAKLSDNRHKCELKRTIN